MELFKTRCTTCHAKLRVHDPAVIGKIVACPKCNSMVLIDPPSDWAPPKVAPRASSDAPVVAVTTDSSGAFSSSTESDISGTSPWASSSLPVPPADANEIKEVDRSSSTKHREEGAEKSPLSETDDSSPDDVTIERSPAEQLARKLTLMMVVPAAGLLAFTLYWIASSLSTSEPTAPRNAPEEVAESDVDEVMVAADEHKTDNALSSSFARRWMPKGTAYALRCGPSFLRSTETMHVVIEGHLPGLWDDLGPLLEDLNAQNVAVDALQWAGQTPGSWHDDCLIVLHLADDSNDVGSWFATGKPTELSVGGAVCRRFESHRWPYPMALIDERILVTGSPNLLDDARLGEKKGLLLSSLAALLDAESEVRASPATAYRFVTDLTTIDAGSFDWLPDWVVKQSSAPESCETLRMIPQAVDLQILEQETPALSIRLRCKSEPDADTVGKAWQQVLKSLDGRESRDLAELEKQLVAGRLSDEEAHEIRGVFEQAVATVQTATSVQEDFSVLVSLRWPGHLDDFGSTIVDSRKSRLRFNGLLLVQGDLSHHQTIVKALTAAASSDGHWPMGAAGAVQLRAETRLSWIASTLPYLEGGDAFDELHRQLNFFRPWNDPANLPITRRPLELFTNPRLGPSTTAAGFPTTHYVGVAGLGAGAALLDPADPKAGVFNVRHRISLGAITDGTSQTIAVLGVTGRLGPWAAGGDATVRPLTAEPYFNGPDHFGSGMSQGMFAGMADGSVRLIAADVDPHVLEQLVTINGGPVDSPQLEHALTPATRPLDGGGTPLMASPLASEPTPETSTDPPTTIEYDEGELQANARVIALLNTRLKAIDFADVTLDDFLEFVAQLTTVKTTFDLDALSDVGVGADDTLSVRLVGATYADIFDAALAPLGLGIIVRHGELVVTTLANQTKLERVATHPVLDLRGDEPSSRETLATVVRTLVDPGTWTTHGGTGRLSIEDNLLVAETNDLVHRRLATFLEKLRVARGLEGNDAVGDVSVSLASRTSRAFEILQTRIEARFDKPTPLVAILSHLQATAGVNLLLDIPALASAGITADVETTLHATGITLEEALTRVCRSLELTTDIKDARTIQITTFTAAEGRLELEFYPIGTQIEVGMSSDALIAKIQTSIAPRSWNPTGGPAAIHFDQTSNCLIVLQTQREQARIEAFLNDQQAQQPK